MTAIITADINCTGPIKKFRFQLLFLFFLKFLGLISKLNFFQKRNVKRKRAAANNMKTKEVKTPNSTHSSIMSPQTQSPPEINHSHSIEASPPESQDPCPYSDPASIMSPQTSTMPVNYPLHSAPSTQSNVTALGCPSHEQANAGSTSHLGRARNPLQRNRVNVSFSYFMFWLGV